MQHMFKIALLYSHALVVCSFTIRQVENDFLVANPVLNEPLGIFTYSPAVFVVHKTCFTVEIYLHIEV